MSARESRDQYRERVEIESSTESESSDLSGALRFESEQPFALESVDSYRDSNLLHDLSAYDLDFKGDDFSDLHDILSRDDPRLIRRPRFATVKQNQRDPFSVSFDLDKLFAMANANQPSILDPDGPLPELPEFPYKDAKHQCAEPSNKQQKILELQSQYQAYATQLELIRGSEITVRGNARTPDYLAYNLRQRQILVDHRDKINRTIAKIQRIDDVKRAFKPSLTIPEDHIEGYIGRDRANNPLPLDTQAVKSFMNVVRLAAPTETSLEATWDKLVAYTNFNKLCHKNFVQALLQSLTDQEQINYLIQFMDKPVDTIAAQMANRFLKETSLSKALHDLGNYKRKPTESIRQCMSRLRATITKAVTIYEEPDKREDAVNTKLKDAIHSLISEDCRKHLVKKLQKFTEQAHHASLEEMVEICEDFERIDGGPHEEFKKTIHLYNTEVYTPPPPPSATAALEARTEQIESKLDTFINLFTSMQVSAPPQVNAALRSVNFDVKPPTTSAFEAKPYKFSDPPAQLPTESSSSRPRDSSSSRSRSDRDRSKDRETFKSYDRYSNSARPSSRSRSRDDARKSQSDRRYESQRSAREKSSSPPRKSSSSSHQSRDRSQSKSPASYWRDKYQITQDKLDDEKKKKLETPAPAPAFTHPPPSYNAPPPPHTYAAPTPQWTAKQRDDAYVQRMEEYRARRPKTGATSNAGYQPNRSRSKSRDGNRSASGQRYRSASRDAKTGYQRYTLPSTRAPIINAHPHSHVTVTGCPVCLSPIDHPIEACFLAREDLQMIDAEISEN